MDKLTLDLLMMFGAGFTTGGLFVFWVLLSATKAKD